MGSNDALLDAIHTRAGTLRSMEVEALISTSTICRRHGALQESLTSVTYLSDIVEDCKAYGLDVEASAKYEEANVLWDHGEQEKSIRIRQELVDYGNFDSQDKKISLPVLLAKLVSLLTCKQQRLLILSGASPGRSSIGNPRKDHTELLETSDQRAQGPNARA